jgi:nitrogen fixation protein FixH
VHDPGFAVEPDYYQHALKWDAEQARQQHSADLGWTLQWDFSNPDAVSATAVAHSRPLALALSNAHGQPLSGARVTIMAFHNARAAEVQHLNAVEQTGGRYTANLDLRRTGIWRLKVSASLGTEQFSQATEVDLNAMQGHPRLTTPPTPQPDNPPPAGQQ